MERGRVGTGVPRLRPGRHLRAPNAVAAPPGAATVLDRDPEELLHTPVWRIRLEKIRDHLSPIGSIDCAQDAHDFVKPFFEGLDREHFLVVCLTASSHVIGSEVVAIGDESSCPVDIANVFKAAILRNARAILVAHNHPNGGCTPSGADINLTGQLLEAAEVMRIRLIDHLVVGDYAYSSLGELGFLE